jgi:hypothetical protein
MLSSNLRGGLGISLLIGRESGEPLIKLFNSIHTLWDSSSINDLHLSIYITLVDNYIYICMWKREVLILLYFST